MAAPPRGRAAQGRTKPPTGRRWVIAGIAALLGTAGLVAWMGSRRDREAELVDRQRAILAATARLQTADIDAFIREADCMTRQEASGVRTALAAEWRRIRQETIVRYFDAPEPDRPALLDDDIARLQNYHRLLAALNPMDKPGGPVRPPRSARGAARPEDAAEADQNSRALAELYDAARAARARARGITLPTTR